MVMERIGQGEIQCNCSAPAVMWECEYFCSVTGSLRSSSTALIEFLSEAGNANSILAISLAEEGA